MLIMTSLPPLNRRRAGRLSFGMVIRVGLALAAVSLAVAPTLAGERPVLRGDVVVRGDVLTLGDLVEGLPEGLARKAAFRAPAHGESGTIQARRILDAAGEAAATIETGGRTQVTVARASRRIDTPEIEAAVKRALEFQHGVDARPLSIAFEGQAPGLAVAPDLAGAPAAEEVVYDRRTRRVSAIVSVGARPGERKASVRVTGTAVELVEATVLNRTLGRGEAVQAGDITVERRPRESLPADALVTALTPGQVAKRSLAAGSVLRAGDLARPEIVGRGDVVTVVYEVPGMVLTLRGRANEAGAQGDVIAVTNPQSKKVLQAQVVAPGKVSVSAAIPGRVAQTPAPAQP